MQQFRIITPNLLYVIGLPRQFAKEEILKKHMHFGQYGKIIRIIINNFTNK